MNMLALLAHVYAMREALADGCTKSWTVAEPVLFGDRVT